MPAGAKPGERRGGRAKGTPNKETIARRAAYDRAFALYQGKQAKDILHKGMVEMTLLAEKYHPETGADPNERLFTQYMRIAKTFAADLLGTQTPQLATVKVGGDRDNPLAISEGVTGAQLRAQFREMIMEMGASKALKMLEPPIEGVANRDIDVA